jgi:organic hydroperoxide reductase OsmC/OhrA
MSEHVVDVSWSRGEHEFTYDTYNRDHEWRFDGGITIPASANPAYLGNPGPVDPEEAFVAALSSCHMLTFLSIAARKRLVVDSYDDHAVGVMAKNPAGRLAITEVTLNPKITWSGPAPAPETLARLHHLSHQECFIANSVTTETRVAGLE